MMAVAVSDDNTVGLMYLTRAEQKNMPQAVFSLDLIHQAIKILEAIRPREDVVVGLFTDTNGCTCLCIRENARKTGGWVMVAPKDADIVPTRDYQVKRVDKDE